MTLARSWSRRLPPRSFWPFWLRARATATPSSSASASYRAVSCGGRTGCCTQCCTDSIDSVTSRQSGAPLRLAGDGSTTASPPAEARSSPRTGGSGKWSTPRCAASGWRCPRCRVRHCYHCPTKAENERPGTRRRVGAAQSRSGARISAAAAIRAVDIEELEDHLRAQFVSLVDAGLTADEAFLVRRQAHGRPRRAVA